MKSYGEFLNRKSQSASMDGFAPLWMLDFLYDQLDAMEVS